MSDYNPTDLAGQAEEEARARKRILRLRETEIADLKWLMSSDRGRRIMWRLLELARVFTLSFDANAMRMAFNEGRRGYGLEILSQLMTACPEQYPAMLKEHQNANGKRDGAGDPTNK